MDSLDVPELPQSGICAEMVEDSQDCIHQEARLFMRAGTRVEQMNVLIHCYMDRSSALLEGEVCYIEVSVVRKGVTQQAAQGCSRQQQPIGGLDILYLNNPTCWWRRSLKPGERIVYCLSSHLTCKAHSTVSIRQVWKTQTVCARSYGELDP